MDQYLKQGKKMGHVIPEMRLSSEQVDAITPKDLRGQTFDGDKAKRELENIGYKNIEGKVKEGRDPRISSVIESSERSLNLGVPAHDSRAEHTETIEKCLIESDLEIVILRHNLSVEVEPGEPAMRKMKTCKGHYEEKKKTDGKKYKEKRERELANDPTVKWFHITVDEGNFGHRDVVSIHWKHTNDADNCNSMVENEFPEFSLMMKEIDVWLMDKPEVLDSLDCTLLKTENGLPETRNIKGYQVTRPSWTKTHFFQCVKQKENVCPFITDTECVFLDEKCLKEVGTHCVQKEIIFKCRNRNLRKEYINKQFYGSDPSLWEISYQPNHSLPDVTTKLAVFEEMKNELKKANAGDARKALLFTGNIQQCSKSVAKDIMYDCCFGMAGLATKVLLSKCTSDELVLSESRRKGLTHYVGKKKEKFLGLWESRTDHVFCVFPTKLARVFQEESRKQLNLEWGSPDHPECRGLTQEEIRSVDFTKLNLLEAFEGYKSFDNKEKIKKVEDRLKQRMESL